MYTIINLINFDEYRVETLDECTNILVKLYNESNLEFLTFLKKIEVSNILMSQFIELLYRVTSEISRAQ